MTTVNGRRIDIVREDSISSWRIHDKLSHLSGIPPLQLYAYGWGDDGSIIEIPRVIKSIGPGIKHYAVSQRPVSLVRYKGQVCWELTINELHQLRDKLRGADIKIVASTIRYEFDEIRETGLEYADCTSPIEGYLQLQPDSDSLEFGTVLLELRALLL